MVFLFKTIVSYKIEIMTVKNGKPSLSILYKIRVFGSNNQHITPTLLETRRYYKNKKIIIPANKTLELRRYYCVMKYSDVLGNNNISKLI